MISSALRPESLMFARAISQGMYPFIHSFIRKMYIVPSQEIYSGAPSPTMVKKISFKQLVEQRRVALW